MLVFLPCFWSNVWAQTSPRLQLELDRTTLNLSTQVQFALPPAVQEAIQKGVTVVFVAKAEVRQRRWWWDKIRSTVVRNYRVSYVPLSRQWRLQVGANQAGAASLATALYFDRVEALLMAIKRIRNWPLLDLEARDVHERYVIDFSYALDIAQLPRPLRIGLLGEREWEVNLKSQIEWTFPEPKEEGG